MSRQWVAFSDAEKSELTEIIKNRFGDIYSDVLIKKLIFIIESSTIDEIDFNDMLDFLDRAKDNYTTLENNEKLTGYLTKHHGKIGALFGFKPYSIDGSNFCMENYITHLNFLNGALSSNGVVVVGCGLTNQEGSEFYIASLDSNIK